MRILRKNFPIRFFSSLLLLLLFNSLFLSNYAWALTSGKEQPEFTSYESAVPSDLVNLATGDFSYSLPLMTVPGPEGSFTIPAFYHAGIGLEQEASWTGLGWNVNVGSITRDVIGYADDAYDDPFSVNVNDPGGSGFVKNFLLYKRTWDSQKGYGGGISLLDLIGADWDSHGLTSGTALGLNFNKNGIKGDWAENVFNVANSLITIASFGASAPETAAEKAASAGAKAVSDGLASAISTGISTGTALYQGYLQQGTFSSSIYGWNEQTKVSALGFKVNYKYWLDATRTERAFGSLYLGSTGNSIITDVCTDCVDGVKSPRIFNSSASNFADYSNVKLFPIGYLTNIGSDMYTYVGDGEKYSDITRPAHVAFDNFKVMTDGVSGNISPYRNEIGSLSQPKMMANNPVRHNLVPFLKEGVDIPKVQFTYNGQFANRYDYHYDTQFGIDHYLHPTLKQVYYNIASNKLKTSRFESNREGLTNGKISGGKFIQWFTNQEIASGTPSSQGLFFEDSEVSSVRSSLPQKGIGGFTITNEAGVTYHYSLPVYNTREVEFIGVKGQETQKFSKSLNNSRVAISWLLTGITGPDFVDRGQMGSFDDQDWGYWVKFSYGLSTGEYCWRNPYYGFFENGNTTSYSFGMRESYYLNSVETRSHVALFSKGIRTDGRGIYYKRLDPNYGHPQEPNDQAPSTPTSSLFLDEIVLLDRSTYNNLTGLGFSSGGNTASELSSGGSYFSLSHIIDTYDLNRNSTITNFINANALKRVKLVYETDPTKVLCQKTINSFADPNNPPYNDASDIYAQKGGKLTLKRIQFMGKNSTKIVPDYIFGYGSNPDYNKDKWDGWGFYNSSGTSLSSSHVASSTDADGAAWSLNKITTPLGSEMNITYERDSYQTVSGHQLLGSASFFNASGSITPTLGTNSFTLSSGGGYNALDRVYLDGAINFTCPATGSLVNLPFTGEYTISSVSGNTITLTTNYGATNYCSTSYPISVSYNGTIKKITKEQKGGDIRVSELSYTDAGGAIYKTKYEYKGADGFTSGVVGKEPEFIKSGDNFGLDKIYDAPTTPVLYGAVTVNSQYNSIKNQYGTRTVFEFETPQINTVTETSTPLNDYVLPGYQYGYSSTIYFKQYLNTVDVNSSSVGNIKSVKTYDRVSSSPSQSVIFNYTSSFPNSQGFYTSGSVLSEFNNSGAQNDYMVLKLVRTMKRYNPYGLVSIVKTANGLTQTETNKTWDFLTGKVLEKEVLTPLGQRMSSIEKQAYKAYPSMASKWEDVTNKNMLSQTVASYQYKLDGSGAKTGLLSADVQTWRNDWGTYRILSGGNYIDNLATADGPPVWRKSSAFYYKSPITSLRTDGTINFSSEYDFAIGASNTGWLKAGETKRYDHYSMPLEDVDINGLYSSVKMGYDNKYKVAEAANAAYTEFAFSSAEDLNTTTNFFGGEIASGGTVVSSSAHTGTKSLQVTTGKGFVFKPGGLSSNRAYRISAWTNSPNGRVYYSNGGGNTTSSASTLQVNGWYLTNLEIPAGTAFNEVGVLSFNGTAVIFDDFRFQPINASVVGYVFDPATGLLQCTLDNNNLFTKYEYNDRGALIKTYRESIKNNGVKLVLENKENYRRFSSNQ